MSKTLLAMSVLLLFAACSGEEHADGGHQKGKASHGSAHWSYKGDDGPSHWAEVSDEFSRCGAGQAQSPVDISGEVAMNLMGIEFYYDVSRDSAVINNGHTIQVNYAPGSYAIIGGKKYDLLQFHFHSPSEHQVHGKHADMVAHLVHKSTDGNLAVIAVLFDKGMENHFLEPVWRVMPKHKGEAIVSAALDINRLLPQDKSYFNYSGSLTTPPCSEGVNWNVLISHVSASASQVAAFTDIFPLSIRPVQPLNNRIIGFKQVSVSAHTNTVHKPQEHKAESPAKDNHGTENHTSNGHSPSTHNDHGGSH